ncbi:hypothetical protein KR093_001721 [Drosophila rubida]|uniref:Uncharacterized protein n=1 Tax=Drosophila rubida TaxID=30044 RepID=A0AAD4JYH4_9MUSC|nr:hypothetical protein KR093_001721 [Drosophila rubida]
MGQRYKKEKDKRGHSYYVECQEHVSIQGRGNVLIKNTQTQVRELYKRHVPIAAEEPSTSSCCTKLMDTSQQMRELNDKIETEIDKLKNFRDCFLQQKEAKNAKQLELKKKPRMVSHKSRGRQLGGACRKLPIEAPPKQQGKDERQSKDISIPNSKKVKKVGESSGGTVSSKPYFSTVRMNSPTLDISKDSSKSNKKLVRFQGLKHDSKRMGGGCNLNFSNDSFTPQSTYQSDYNQSMASQASSYPYHCQMANHYDYSAAGYYYPSDPCNHYDVGAVCDCPPALPVGAVCDCPPALPSYNRCAPTSYSRRTTDLQCDEYLRNLTPSPREKLPPKKATPIKRPKRRKLQYPSKTAQKSGQIHEEKQAEDKTEASKEKNKTKVTVRKRISESDEEKERMHREYMDNYKMEHEKTAKKEASSRSSLLGSHPTYTKITPGTKIKAEPDNQREGNRNDRNEGYKQREGPERQDGYERNEGYGRGQGPERRDGYERDEGYKRREGQGRPDGNEAQKQRMEAMNKLCIGYGTQTSSPIVHDVGLTCSFKCPTCVAQPELKKTCVGCATQASGPPVKEIGLNCSLSCRPCVENPELKKKCVGCATQVSAPACKDIGLNCSLSQRANCNQSCQTTCCQEAQREVPTQTGISSRSETSARQQLSPDKSSDLCASEIIKTTQNLYSPSNKKHQSAPQMTSAVPAADPLLNTVYMRQDYKQSSPNSTNRNWEEAYTSPETTQMGSRGDSPQRHFGDTSYRWDEESSAQFTLPMNSCNTSMNSNKTSPRTQWHYCNTPTESSNEDGKNINIDQSFKEPLNQMPSPMVVCEKRTRCVKFNDETSICERVNTVKCSRNFIDWERLCDNSKEDLTCLDELNNFCDDLNQRDLFVNESCRKCAENDLSAQVL